MMFHSLEKNKSSDAKNRQRTIEKNVIRRRFRVEVYGFCSRLEYAV